MLARGRGVKYARKNGSLSQEVERKNRWYKSLVRNKISVISVEILISEGASCCDWET